MLRYFGLSSVASPDMQYAYLLFSNSYSDAWEDCTFLDKLIYIVYEMPDPLKSCELVFHVSFYETNPPDISNAQHNFVFMLLSFSRRHPLKESLLSALFVFYFVLMFNRDKKVKIDGL